mgnify:CR=1 FL=1
MGVGVYVGIGATVIDHITIGAGSVIGAGAVVTKDLPDRVLAVGVPAKVVKEVEAEAQGSNPRSPTSHINH